MRVIKNQDGKLVTRTKPAIPVFLCDYFFFFFAAFFLAAMFITSDRFMEFPSAIFAVGVIYFTEWLYEEMPGAGNDYFNDTFPAGFRYDSRTPIKSSARHKFRFPARGQFEEFFDAASRPAHPRDHRRFKKTRGAKWVAAARVIGSGFATLAPDEQSSNADRHEDEA